MQYAPAGFLQKPSVYTRPVRAQRRAAQMPRPAEQRRRIRGLQVDLGMRLVFKDRARPLRPARFFANGAEYVEDALLAAVAAEKERFQIAPPLALQVRVDLWLGPPLGKRRYAQRMRKRPSRFTLEGRLQRLWHARDRRSPHVERAQYGVQEFAEHGRLRSFAQSSGV